MKGFYRYYGEHIPNPYPQIRFGSAITHCQSWAIFPAILSAVLARENKAESQDMLAMVEEKINNNLIIGDLVFFSTDVKSLYLFSLATLVALHLTPVR